MPDIAFMLLKLYGIECQGNRFKFKDSSNKERIVTFNEGQKKKILELMNSEGKGFLEVSAEGQKERDEEVRKYLEVLHVSPKILQQAIAEYGFFIEKDGGGWERKNDIDLNSGKSLSHAAKWAFGIPDKPYSTDSSEYKMLNYVFKTVAQNAEFNVSLFCDRDYNLITDTLSKEKALSFFNNAISKHGIYIKEGGGWKFLTKDPSTVLLKGEYAIGMSDLEYPTYSFGYEIITCVAGHVVHTIHTSSELVWCNREYEPLESKVLGLVANIIEGDA